MMKVIKDQTIVVTSGSYSDYSIHAHLKFLKDFDIIEAEKEYAASLIPDLIEQYRYRDTDPIKYWNRNAPSITGFVAWLIANQYAEEMDVDELHADDWRDNDHLELEWH